MKRIVFILFLVPVFWSSQAQQIEPLKQNIDFHIDSIGNAHLTVSMHLNAIQWNNFKQAVGNNIAILKRSMERALPAYFLDNFKYSEDAMKQTYSLKFDALGVCKIDGQGKWIVEMDSKSPDVTKISDRLYLLNSTMNSGGTLIQQNTKVSFPKSSKDIIVKKDAFGNAYFSYMEPKLGQISLIWLIVGCIFTLVGLGWGYINLKKA